MDYRQAGVDVEAGRAFVETIRSLVEGTRRPGVLGGLGGFGGYFELPAGYQQPVLVSGTDGVGTKLKLAHRLNRHHTVGIDLVAMCVNDVLTSGAEPLYFLDYLATGELAPEQLTQVVAGVAEGCRQSGCALLGGETAEMPGFYGPGEYDMAGFCVGIVEKSAILAGAQVQVGDVLIGLPSSGVHSNGYSLVRKIMAEAPRREELAGSDPTINQTVGYSWDEYPQLLGGQSLGDVLLTPTQLYVKPILAALKSGLEIHAMAHITGGGFPENLPRCLGENQSIYIENDSWPVLPIFKWLQAAGDVAWAEMFKTFNMGIGFVVVVPAAQAEAALTHFPSAYRIGTVIDGTIDGNGVVTGLPEG
ncbi:phosphoribosylformylglycinamidine cyclo-ligase [Leptolyngbya cf. ectocarpi LEGE 11479]|uniref:Phosphoribosylformylglycinamidine cyclo-ligase n=1 Tax=Leptolyngbya cf. ectocarpi LEGE 11479 TaxID=1828722 RepID=A0A928ZTT9_LEPEC|nr:phosphoribosylformylglycinamidine cyclo-ligase [Leptolyngbya ectocarpi]MBE9067214.1 phosphoribosylformylglycinamidine cyclo-ligase [Leptolyngbya cf. ectocarpi LEGE 11479]